MRLFDQTVFIFITGIFLTLSCKTSSDSPSDSGSTTSGVDGRTNPLAPGRPNSASYWQAMKAVSSRYHIPVRRPPDIFEVTMQHAQVGRLTRKVRLPKGEAVVTPPWNLESGDRWGIQVGNEKYGVAPLKNEADMGQATVDIVYTDGKGLKKEFSVDDPQSHQDIKKLVKYLDEISAKDPDGIAPSLRDAFNLLLVQQETY